MRKCARVATLVLLMEVLFHSRAHAQNNNLGNLDVGSHDLVGAGAFIGLVVNFTFTTVAAQGKPLEPAWLALTEIIVTAPQVPTMLYLSFHNTFSLDTPERVLLAVGSLWPAALACHGGWSLMVGGAEPIHPTHRAATWSPTVVSDGIHVAPAFGISGAF